LGLHWRAALVITIGLEGMCIVFYYFVVGQIVNLVPDIFEVDMKADGKFFPHLPGGEYLGLRILAMLQFGFFIAGVFAICLFSFRNFRLLFKVVR
jgi:hypothetical protein